MSSSQLTMRVLAVVALAAACSGDERGDDGAGLDGGSRDAAPSEDAGDAAASDAGPVDATAGPDATVTPFVLVASYPADGEIDAWLPERIVLELSHPIDPASVDGSLTVEADGAALAVDLSVEGSLLVIGFPAPPVLPALVTVAVAAGLRDTAGAAFPGAELAYGVALWQAPPAAGVAERFAFAVAADDTAFAARVTGGSLTVARLGRPIDGGWADLGTPVANDASAVALAVSDAPVVAWPGAGGVVGSARWSGTSWSPLGGLGASAAAPALGRVLDLAADTDGAMWLAVLTPDAEVVVARLAPGADSWQPWGAALAAPGTTDVAVAGEVTRVAVALSGAGVSVWRGSGAAWSIAGGGPVDLAGRAADLAGGGTLTVAWQRDEASSDVHVARLSGGAWQRIGPGAADLEIEAEASGPTLIGGTTTYLAWEERDATARVRVARVVAGRLEIVGEALGDAAPGAPLRPALGKGGDRLPQLGFRASASGGIEVRRFGGSPELPVGLVDRPPTGACVIAAAPAAQLGDTGCYASLAGHVLVPEAIPYSLNSPLWSDGAWKRRFVIVPDGQTLGYVADLTGTLTDEAFGFPVGAILIKEFWLEAVVGDPTTRFPVETRFLVKRCEPGVAGCTVAASWQGYSYEWNAGGTAATLLTNTSASVTQAWPVVEGGSSTTHVHTYPGRDQCVRCHTSGVGRVLGFQARQLNKLHDYGQASENQLAALRRIGLFGSSLGSAALAAAPVLPRPADAAYSLEQRSRSYLHANCSHCHRAGGEMSTLRLRYTSSLDDTNLCDPATSSDEAALGYRRIEPGDPATSVLVLRDATRGTSPSSSGPMPPLATGEVDVEHLARLEAWIGGMTSCP